jgi:hypothetical protein
MSRVDGSSQGRISHKANLGHGLGRSSLGGGAVYTEV